MDNGLAERTACKIDLLLIDVAIIKTRSEESEKLSHEPRIRLLETLVSSLVSSVDSLVKAMEDKKESNQYLITTSLAAIAVLISVYAIIKH